MDYLVEGDKNNPFSTRNPNTIMALVTFKCQIYKKLIFSTNVSWKKFERTQLVFNLYLFNDRVLRVFTLPQLLENNTQNKKVEENILFFPLFLKDIMH
ncbi:hypothetical protein [Calidifontibacillus erzurumensis]|uniref:Uncharacterized protein n=1 Tax=Calidifontibacillus erzurumensis TaxID=2741433 RepID=A0A8J8GDI4_9BACI|nr:hypothetical protein [Calidifontibacillus erzurumensis]NSL51387.1 hypothetical protein [Calidifontibacillus erzurumensis]